MALSIPEHLQGKLDETISEVIEKGPDGLHWSFGGGSALECWIGHRKSEDIDIFLLDPQALPYFSPSREMVTITTDYKEDHLTLKLLLPDYQIDMIASPPLLGPVNIKSKRSDTGIFEVLQGISNAVC